MVRKVLLAVITIATIAVLCAVVPIKANAAQSWDFGSSYSTTSNPNGAWSWGRKWAVEGGSFDLFTVRWDSGWYLGNWGHGGPSIADHCAIWAKDNSNGYPVVRWTCPEAGAYNISGSFTGADSRGVDNFVYVVVDEQTGFSDRVTSDGDSAPFSLDDLQLQQGDSIDFVAVWGGGVTSESSWTHLGATITTVPEPASIIALFGGLGSLLAFRLRSRA